MRPAVLLKVLGPLVIADRHAAGIGQEIGDHRNAALLQNPIRRGRGGFVGAFDHDLAVDCGGVGFLGNHATKCGRYEPVAGNRPQLVVRDSLAATPFWHGFPLCDVRE